MALTAAEQDEGGREGDTVVLGFDSGDDLGEEARPMQNIQGRRGNPENRGGVFDPLAMG